MNLIKLNCPHCGRVLGDTMHSVDCNFNCRGCRQTVRVKIDVATFKDYERLLGKESEDNDKSK